MSDESIIHKEDKENLLYISRKIQLEEFSIVEDHCHQKDSIVTTESDISTTRVGSDINIYNRFSRNIGPDTFNDPAVVAKIKPFELKWTYGINSKTGIKNLTSSDRKDIFFASCHSPMIYDYCTKQMKHLEGHQLLITWISADNTGRWLVTASGPKDGCLIIWDSLEYKSIFTLFAPYAGSGILVAEISGSARYLISIGITEEGDYTVDFWLWTLGNEKPDDSFKVERTSGAPVAICFNPDIEEHIMIAFQKNVYLVIWDNKAKKFSKPVVPQIMHKNKIGNITGATYLSRCHECYASSNKGCLLIFGNTLYPKPYEEGELDNAKIFRNAVRVSPVSIGCCTTTDGLLVTGDKRGSIFFFDSRVRLVYWLRNYYLASITSISFNSVPKFKRQEANVYYTPKYHDDRIFECNYEDIVEELEMFFRQDLPTDATAKKNPFIVNDFFVCTTDSNIYAIDCLNDKCVPLFLVADACVSAIELHDESPFMVVGYENGRIIMINYETNEMMSNILLPESSDPDESMSITCIKYSGESMHLVCGRENGEIWVLEPILLTPKTNSPYTATRNKVVKIIFSTNITQFAYYDTNRTVVIFTYDLDSSEWRFAGKIRPHYADINDIMFMPSGQSSTLYTISNDRHIVEYNNQLIENEEFGIITRERIEQTAIPMNFIYWVESSEITKKKNGYFIVADNEHKIKFLYQTTKIPKLVVLAPAFGCFKHQQIRKMKIIPNWDLRYMAFLTKKHIGLQILPPDGNPYKYVGYLAHPNEVVDFALSSDGKYIFTFGRDDHCVFKWEIKPRAVELTHLLGGRELEPFYCLIEGGKNGWLFQEIKDVFYYMQILQQENIDLPRRVSDSICLSELPDLVRTCGFYPSEFELENMMIDVKYRNYNENGNINEEVNFIDFVKLFCNHKPAYGYSKEKVENAFNVLEKSVGHTPGQGINTEEFIQMLTTAGESLSHSNIDKYLRTLMRVSSHGEEETDYLPEDINFETLYEDILGIDMSRSQITEGNQDDPKDEDESD